jgi:hypothetical protein
VISISGATYYAELSLSDISFNLYTVSEAQWTTISDLSFVVNTISTTHWGSISDLSFVVDTNSITQWTALSDLSYNLANHVTTGTQNMLTFVSSMSSTAISNTLFTDNSNMYFRTALHNTLVPNYVYFHNTNADRTISTNVPASTFVSIFENNPVLSANQVYCIDFCATMLSFSTGFNVDTYMRVSGGASISSINVTLTTCATAANNGAVVIGYAKTVVTTLSSGSVLIHDGANNQPNRNIQGHVVVRTGSTGGSFVIEIAATATGSPVLMANTGMRVQWLGPAGSDITFGTYE